MYDVWYSKTPHIPVFPVRVISVGSSRNANSPQGGTYAVFRCKSLSLWHSLSSIAHLQNNATFLPVRTPGIHKPPAVVTRCQVVILDSSTRSARMFGRSRHVHNPESLTQGNVAHLRIAIAYRAQVPRPWIQEYRLVQPLQDVPIVAMLPRALTPVRGTKK